jgi:hypothetical protein
MEESPAPNRSVDDAGDETYSECESCHGIWVDWYREEPSMIARRVPSRPSHASRGQRGGACPRDGTALTERPYLDAGPVVERCPTCLGLFARPAQVRALASFHERLAFEPHEPIMWVSWLSRFWHAFVK